MTIDIDSIRRQLGQSTVDFDDATIAPMRALGAAFERPERVPELGEPIPAGWHVGYFQPAIPRSELGQDGLPLSTGVLPHIPLPRRVHGGSQLLFEDEIRVGDSLKRETVFSDARVIEGRSGKMILTEVTRTIHTPRGVAIIDRRRLIFRNSASTLRSSSPAADPVPRARAAIWSRQHCADTLTLFRYSAAVMATHRIHYDLPYATQEEGYPGLVVQGPYTQQCMIDLVTDNYPGQSILSFDMKTRAPIFGGEPFQVCGVPTEEGAELWAVGGAGQLAMEATVTLAPSAPKR